jgi:hypothetical protein
MNPSVLPIGWNSTRISVGILLVAASFLKANYLITTPVPLGNWLLGSPWLSLCLIEVELFVGLLLLSGKSPSKTKRVSVVLFSGFALVSIVQALRKTDDCGCLGHVAIAPWQMVILDVAALGALVLCSPPSCKPPLSRFLEVVIPTMFGFGAFLAFQINWLTPLHFDEGANSEGHGSTFFLEPEQWVGREFPLFKHIEKAKELQKGEWLIVLFRPECELCHKTIAKLALSKMQKIALVEISPNEQFHSFPESDPARFAFHGRLDSFHDWFIRAPAILFLTDGVVQRVASSERAFELAVNLQ